MDNAFYDFIVIPPKGFFAIGINKLTLGCQNRVDSLGAHKFNCPVSCLV